MSFKFSNSVKKGGQCRWVCVQYLWPLSRSELVYAAWGLALGFACFMWMLSQRKNKHDKKIGETGSFSSQSVTDCLFQQNQPHLVVAEKLRL